MRKTEKVRETEHLTKRRKTEAREQGEVSERRHKHGGEEQTLEKAKRKQVLPQLYNYCKGEKRTNPPRCEAEEVQETKRKTAI